MIRPEIQRYEIQPEFDGYTYHSNNSGYWVLYANVKALEAYCTELEKQLCVPKWETVEAWEKRTGEVYPDDGPVWMDGCRDLMSGYILVKYIEAKSSWLPLFVANHHGKPPEEKA